MNTESIQAELENDKFVSTILQPWNHG